LGKSEVIDTVRFPRTTLLINSGDCDDTSALLGSLLESSGIRTAVMTSPGHVFLAMDTGEPEENIWLFKRGRYEAIKYDGKVWIPIETTVLGEGFHQAWLEASKLVKDYTPQKKIEFLPVHELRDMYPPLPLPESSFTVVEPEKAIIEKQFAASVDTVTDSIYRNGLKALEERLASSSGRRDLKVRNQIGVLHARFGHDGEAEQILRGCIDEDAGFLPSYVNLANILLSKGNLDSAQTVVQSGLAKRSDSVLLNLLMARIALRKGNTSSALRYYRLVKQKSSHLADRYAGLFEGLEKGGRGRAGVDEGEFGLIWDSGE
jgi:hypothetical protein